MRTFPLDVRYALRALLKRPASTAVVVLTLALGLGANAAVLAMVDALIVRPFPFPDVDRILLLSDTSRDSEYRREQVAPANFLDWKRQSDRIQRLSAFSWWDVNLVGRDEPERVQGFRVSADFFPALGVQPALGRGFLADEETPGRHRRAVIGHGLWQRRFGGDPAIVGRTITLDAEPYEVVGVAPQGFDFPMGAEVWAPLAFDATAAAQRTSRYLTVIGRLAPGASLEDARAQMTVIAERLQQQYPATNRDRGVRVYTLSDGMLDPGLTPILALWQAAALFVLIIGCTNVVNLLLARGAERQRDIAVRVAMGANRRRVVRELLIESLLLGLLATPAALATAWAGLRVLVSYMPAKIARFVPGWHDIDLDGRLVAFTLLLAMGTAIVFGLLPALQSSRGRILDGLKDGARGASPGRHRMRRALVVAEMALALPLLVASGMSAVGVNRFLNGPQGFNPDHLLSLQVVLAEGRHPDAAAWLRFTNAAVERLAAAGGVREAAAVNVMPAAPTTRAGASRSKGIPNPDPQNPPDVDYRTATPEDLRHARHSDPPGTRVHRRRSRRRPARGDREPVDGATLLARRRSHRTTRENRSRQRAVAHRGRRERRFRPELVQPSQQPDVVPAVRAGAAGRFALLARTIDDPVRFAADARAVVRAVDPEQPVFDVLSMRQVLKERTLGLQYVAAIMTVFGGFALVLAIVGVYSVMAYLVAQRTHEFGIRLALGATPREVVRLTVIHTVKVTLLGVLVGAALAIALGRLVEAGLVGAADNDVRLIVAIGVVLMTAAAAAGYLPARRAAATDPIVALRTE